MLVYPTKVNQYVKIGDNSKIWSNCNIYGSEKFPVIIGNNVNIGSFTEIKPNTIIGNCCRIQYGCFIPEGVIIEDSVFIGPRVTFTNDKFPDIVKTHRGTWKSLETLVKSYSSIGAGVVILPGITIYQAAQIGAGSVITKNVDPYAIVAGNPAKKVGDIRDEKFKNIYSELLEFIAKERECEKR
jgi:acetyltransferase-like isoleucine patch superfamily enzyme